MRVRDATAALVISCAVTATANHAQGGTAPDLDSLVPAAVPGQDLPIIREHTYRMSGKVRMLLLWVGRDDVGSGLIKWRGAGDEVAYELLIGSDPQRAPGQLNKWGYLVEHLAGDQSTVIGLISQDREDKLSDVKTGTREDYRSFDTIRGRVLRGEAHARVGTLAAPGHLTYRAAPTVLERVLGDRSLPSKRIQRAEKVASGFLSSLVVLMRSAGEGAMSKRRATPQRLAYIHGDRLYELRVLESTLVPRYERDGRTYHNVVRGRFETGQMGQRSGTKFELVYGTSGDLAHVPILISYQPKWWLHVDLILQI